MLFIGFFKNSDIIACKLWDFVGLFENAGKSHGFSKNELRILNFW